MPSRLAAERSSWVVGVLADWVVFRLVLCGMVVGSMVVTGDMKWFLFLVCERGLGKGVTLALAADSSLNLPDSSQARPIRPCPCPIRPFLGFVHLGE